MSNLSFLEKLLDGALVEWTTLEETTALRRGRVMSKGYLVKNSGEYPVYSSQTARNGMIGKIDTFDFDGEYVSWTTDGANAGTVFYRTGKSSITNVCGVIMGNGRRPLYHKFIYYWLSITAKRHVTLGMGNPKLMSHQVEKIPIPIPCPDNPERSLSIQAEIVRILDVFTELTAELTLREKQYKYYREQLLDFKRLGGDVVLRPLGDIAQYSKTRISSDYLDKSNYVGVDNLLQNRAGRVDSNYVPTSGNLTEYHKDDILIGNIRPYLRKIWLADRTGGTNGDVLVIHPTDDATNPCYLYQVLTDENFFQYNIQHSKGAKMPRGSKPQILRYHVPIPCPDNPEKSLAIQAEIVRMLDVFSELTTSLTDGLPREIALRQQQYAYYRDLLLNFPKPGGGEVAA